MITFENKARFLDRYAGFFLCLIFKFFYFPRFFHRGGAGFKKILVLKFWEGGAIIAGRSWYSALREKFPESRIDFFTLDVNREIVSMLGIADNIYSLKTGGILSFSADLLKKISVLRGNRYDIALDLEYLSRFSALLSGVLGAGRSAGFRSGHYWRGGIHGVNIPFDPERHVYGLYEDFFGFLGLPGPSPVPPGESFFEEPPALPEGGKIVVLNLNSKKDMAERNWPLENYIAVAEYFSSKPGYCVVLLSQRKISEKRPEREGIFDLSGRLNWRQMAGLFRKTALFITHDSGPMHLAFAVKCPTVAIFGPETPSRYGPREPGNEVIYKGIDCSPCVDVFNGKKIKCARGENLCVSTVAPEEVIKASERLLAGERG